jgi:hypothetical protein
MYGHHVSVPTILPLFAVFVFSKLRIDVTPRVPGGIGFDTFVVGNSLVLEWNVTVPDPFNEKKKHNQDIYRLLLLYMDLLVQKYIFTQYLRTKAEH